MARAYLVGVIDTKASPPKLKGAGFFSEPCPTVGGFTFVLADVGGTSYSEAEAHLRSQLRAHPGTRWMLELVKER